MNDNLQATFILQEQVLTPDTAPFVINPKVDELGSFLLPLLNNFVSTDIETFKYSDPDFVKGNNFYPGLENCKWDPHAKWHLQTSIALTDFIFLSDQMHQLFVKHQSAK